MEKYNYAVSGRKITENEICGFDGKMRYAFSKLVIAAKIFFWF